MGLVDQVVAVEWVAVVAVWVEEQVAVVGQGLAVHLLPYFRYKVYLCVKPDPLYNDQLILISRTALLTTYKQNKQLQPAQIMKQLYFQKK